MIIEIIKAIFVGFPAMWFLVLSFVLLLGSVAVRSWIGYRFATENECRDCPAQCKRRKGYTVQKTKPPMKIAVGVRD